MGLFLTLTHPKVGGTADPPQQAMSENVQTMRTSNNSIKPFKDENTQKYKDIIYTTSAKYPIIVNQQYRLLTK
jgi:hypothetical protein